jgi:hypothetical protein
MDCCDTVLPKVHSEVLQACMDPSGSDDDECFSVQLDSSDMAPNTTKVILSHLA